MSTSQVFSPRKCLLYCRPRRWKKSWGPCEQNGDTWPEAWETECNCKQLNKQIQRGWVDWCSPGGRSSVMGWRPLLTPALILAFLSMTHMGSPRVMPRETEAIWSWLPWCYQATLRKWSSFVIFWPPSTPLPACHSPALGWQVRGSPIRPPVNEWRKDGEMAGIHSSFPSTASLFSSSPGTPFSEHWTWWFDLFFHIFPLFFPMLWEISSILSYDSCFEHFISAVMF